MYTPTNCANHDRSNSMPHVSCLLVHDRPHVRRKGHVFMLVDQARSARRARRRMARSAASSSRRPYITSLSGSPTGVQTTVRAVVQQEPTAVGPVHQRILPDRSARDRDLCAQRMVRVNSRIPALDGQPLDHFKRLFRIALISSASNTRHGHPRRSSRPHRRCRRETLIQRTNASICRCPSSETYSPFTNVRRPRSTASLTHAYRRIRVSRSALIAHSYNRRWRRGGGHSHHRLSGKCATKCSVRLVSSSVLRLALVLCVCGQGQPTPTAQGVTTTPPDIAGPPSTTRFVPPMEQINRSDTSSALGRVCWVIFEVQEHLAGLLGTALSSPEGRDPPDEAKAVDVWRRLKRLLVSVPEALGADADLPADARRFRESLLKASKDALAYVERQPERQSIERRAQSHQALAGLLHLAELPGAQEFQLLAVPNSVACPHLAG